METQSLSGKDVDDCPQHFEGCRRETPARSRDVCGPYYYGKEAPCDICLPCWCEKVARPEDVEPDMQANAQLHRQLQEHFVTKQAINIWAGPKYPNYNTLIERVKSFENSGWPEINPSPVSLAEAGFFYDRKLTAFLKVSIECYYI
jgi:hypothetical protein